MSFVGSHEDRAAVHRTLALDSKPFVDAFLMKNMSAMRHYSDVIPDLKWLNAEGALIATVFELLLHVFGWR
jgi:hypothetical protein